jgi:hypothetical protein
MIDYRHVERFESATVLLPVMNETTSLKQTVAIILRDAEDPESILAYVPGRTAWAFQLYRRHFGPAK